MLTGTEAAAACVALGVTHVVWVPDSTLGTWEAALVASPSLRLVRVCREGEAWALAAGLYIGGRQPLVVMQSTGLFESGDALRNVLFDLALPLWAVIGYRNYLVAGSTDTARRYAEPILAAWGLEWLLIDSPGGAEHMVKHLQAARAAQRPGVVLLAEGKG